MPHYMIHEMFLSSETLLTYITTVGSFPCMFANMINHMLLTSKSFVAVLTPKNLNLNLKVTPKHILFQGLNKRLFL